MLNIAISINNIAIKEIFQFKTAAIKTHHLIETGHSKLFDRCAVVLKKIENA